MISHALILQSFWRSSSTYFWNKTRTLPSTISLYEPFHEGLNCNDGIPSKGARDWESGHPPEIDQYFSEYSLIDDASTPLLEQLPNQFMRNGYYNCNQARQKYLRRIVNNTERQGYERIVLGCTRSIACNKGILKALEREIPYAKVSSVLLRRNPLDQLSSALTQHFVHNNSYFACAHVLPLINGFPSIAADCGFSPEWIIEKGNDIAAIELYCNFLPMPVISLAKAFLANAAISYGLSKNSYDYIFELNTDQLSGASGTGMVSLLESWLNRQLGFHKEINLDDFNYRVSKSIISAELFACVAKEVLCILDTRRAAFDEAFLREIIDRPGKDAAIQVNLGRLNAKIARKKAETNSFCFGRNLSNSINADLLSKAQLLKKNHDQLQEINQKIKSAEDDFSQLKQSFSWKITSPFRKIYAILKRSSVAHKRFVS